MILCSFTCTLLALPAAAQEPTAPAPEPVAPAASEVVLGAGDHSYRWVEGFGTLPDGDDLGNTHGCMVVDKQGRILLNTDSERAVVMFSADGEYLGAWGKEFRGGLHGMAIATETVPAAEPDGEPSEVEYLYLSHLTRHEVCKTTLDGEVLWTLGYPKASGIYKDASEYRPTGVAVGPDGSIYVADGYGKSWIHQFDSERRYVRSWGGPGTEPGQFKTPHGIWLDTRRDQPRLVVADRENHRLQEFDLDGKLLGVITGMLRRPCSLYQHGTDLVVADLAGRVTILDRDNKLVCHLGDNPDPKKRARNDVPKSAWKPGEFVSPHSACFDRDGNLYVMDWLKWGRVSKLERIL